jgi:hypothetical protein
LEVLDWILLARDRDKEQAFVNTVMKFPVIWNPGEFIDLLRNYYFLEKDSDPWSWFVLSLVICWFQWIVSSVNRADFCTGDNPCFIRNVQYSSLSRTTKYPDWRKAYILS